MSYPYPSGPVPNWQQQPVQNHPRALAALILGIVGIPFICSLAAPFAIWMGASALSGINRSNGTVGGRGLAIAGLVLGIVDCALLLIGILVYVVFIASASVD